MKRVILVTLVLLALVTITIGSVSGFVNTAMAENTIPYININDYGDEVIALHQKLRELGYYHLRAESPWSRKSAEAVKILQENMGETVTGEVRSKEEYDVYMNARGKNLLLGTNQGTKNYSISQNGFETELTSLDGIEVKVAIKAKSEDAGWLTLFFNDGRSKEILSSPAGEEYTLSFDARSNVENAQIIASHKQGNAKENQIHFGQVDVGSEWQHVTLTSTTTGVAAAGQGLYLDLRNNAAGTEISIRNLKLERGSKGTEWCPADED